MKLNYGYPEGKDDYSKCDYKEYDRKKCEDRKKPEYKEYDKCCDEHKYAHCYPKSPCPYPILFECANGTGTSIQGVLATDTRPFVPRTIGCLTIDTTCLKNPVVKFDFNSVIRYLSVDATVGPAYLTFELCKQCGNGDEICCGNWHYEIDTATNGERLTNSYGFSHCECNSCPGCCTYTVKIIDARNLGVNNILDLCNVTLQAFAKSSC